MTLTDYIEAGLLVPKAPNLWHTGDEAYRVWWDDTARLWRWSRLRWADNGSTRRNHGGKPTLRGCLWDAAMA